MDSLLKSIKTSLEGVKFDLDQDINETRDGISLLALKNESLVAYLHNLILVIAGMLERASLEEPQQEKNAKLLNEAILGTVTQRVVLEKGVKGLETKMQYQIEKVLRAFMKAKQDAENSLNDENVKKSTRNIAEVDSDDEALAFKPNPNALSNNDEGSSSASRRSGANDNQGTSTKGRDFSTSSTEKYVAPKLSAVAPSFGSEKPTRPRRNFTMEEYLESASGAPTSEPSIGSTIMDNGRGGSRTEADRRKQKAVQNYEEENYTRLPGVSSKQQRREARQRQVDSYEKNLFGEDWRFLDSIGKDDTNRPASKKRKTMSAWERAKKNSSL